MVRFLPLIMMLAIPSFAQARSQEMASGCVMQETASLGTNWNGVSETAKGVRGLFESRMKQIQEYAKKAGVEKLDLQSHSYNINVQNNGIQAAGYQYNGNASFMVKPADKAVDLLDLLTKNGIQSSLNVNMYKSGSCQ